MVWFAAAINCLYCLLVISLSVRSLLLPLVSGVSLYLVLLICHSLKVVNAVRLFKEISVSFTDSIGFVYLTL